jgi:hypothetical protein
MLVEAIIQIPPLSKRNIYNQDDLLQYHHSVSKSLDFADVLLYSDVGG